MKYASKKRQLGFWQAILPAAASLVGGILSNKSNESQNDATMANNAEQAQLNRDFQERMRATQYQTAIGDLKSAGLNPMLAYQNGGAGTPQGATANSGQRIPMQNIAAGLQTSALTAAQVEQTKAQTAATEALAEKTRAEIPQTIANTGNITQQTKNLEETVSQIRASVNNIKMDTLSKEEQVTLTRAQQQLTNIQKDLARENISFVEAQTKTQRVITQLKGYEIPGAKNTADFEKMLSTGGGSAAGIAGTAGTLLNSAKKVFGK